MDTTRRITDLAPEDVPVVERLFGQPLDKATDAVLILRLPESAAPTEDDELPSWCNVLDGMSDQDVDEFNAILKLPVRIAKHET